MCGGCFFDVLDCAEEIFVRREIVHELGGSSSAEPGRLADPDFDVWWFIWVLGALVKEWDDEIEIQGFVILGLIWYGDSQ